MALVLFFGSSSRKTLPRNFHAKNISVTDATLVVVTSNKARFTFSAIESTKSVHDIAGYQEVVLGVFIKRTYSYNNCNYYIVNIISLWVNKNLHL